MTDESTSLERRVGLWITWATKVAGIVIAIHEGFTTKDPYVIGMAGFMLAGAQGAENAIKGLKDR